jgi:hypothetical protein
MLLVTRLATSPLWLNHQHNLLHPSPTGYLMKKWKTTGHGQQENANNNTHCQKLLHMLPAHSTYIQGQAYMILVT